MIQIVERELKIKGAEAKDVLFFADMHLTLCDEREDDYVQGLAKERIEYFPHAYSGAEELKRYLDETKPDAVVGCGDIIDMPSRANLEYLSELFNGHCKEYLYVLGNHDWNYPRNYNNIYNWRGNVPKFASVLKDGNPYVQVVDMGGFLLVGIDTNTDKVFPDTVDALEKVAARGIPMILVMHVGLWTPGTADIIVEASPEDLLLAVGCPEFERKRVGRCPSCLGDETSDRLLALLNAPDSPIVAAVYGHVHYNHKPLDFLAEDEYREGRFQYGVRISSPHQPATPTAFLLHVRPM